MRPLRIVTLWFALAALTCGALAQPPGGDLATVTPALIAGWFDDPVDIGQTLIAPGYREVTARGKTVGAIFLTDGIKPIPAYSGTPVSVLVAIDSDGRITGARIHRHREPILVTGVDGADLERFAQRFTGLRAGEPIRFGGDGPNTVDGIAGATITTLVITRSITLSAQTVFAAMQAAAPPAADEAAMRWESWAERRGAVAVMAAALAALLLILLFQDWLVRRPALFRRVRISYLAFTAVVIGYLFSAQLSVINLFAFLRNFSGGFSWDSLLIDPVIFLLWAFTAISLLLWGRGVFCGWLCPFGALQELIHRAARRFSLPSFALPPALNERLWVLKYFLLIALLGLSLDSFETMAALAEVEPFKTTFTLGFARPWPYGAYAGLLLLAAVFTGKFYCRYLCALGAGLSVLGRLRIFDWLHRRSLCGNPCQSCARLCPNGAIRETGEIIAHECHYCLECQLAYWDHSFCPAHTRKRQPRTGRATAEPEVNVIAIERRTP